MHGDKQLSWALVGRLQEWGWQRFCLLVGRRWYMVGANLFGKCRIWLMAPSSNSAIRLLDALTLTNLETRVLETRHFVLLSRSCNAYIGVILLNDPSITLVSCEFSVKCSRKVVQFKTWYKKFRRNMLCMIVWYRIWIFYRNVLANLKKWISS